MCVYSTIVSDAELKERHRCTSYKGQHSESQGQEEREIAPTPVQNLASHIAAIAYANFLPCSEKWSGPKGLPKGCAVMLSMMKFITDSHFKPIHPVYVLNEVAVNITAVEV